MLDGRAACLGWHDIQRRTRVCQSRLGVAQTVLMVHCERHRCYMA